MLRKRVPKKRIFLKADERATLLKLGKGLGPAAKYYFEHGASWGADSPKTIVKRILAATDKQSVLERLKKEINAKIKVNPHAKGPR